MILFFEKLVRKRNPAFRFDPSLGVGDVLYFVLNQFISILRGAMLLFKFRNSQWMLRGRGVQFFYLSKIKWGRYVKLGDYVYLSGLGKAGISLGKNVGIGAFSRLVVGTSFDNIGQFINIGNYVSIGEYAYLGGAGGLNIGDECIIGQYFSCHPENHDSSDLDKPIRLQGVSRKGINIGKNCWIGSKVTILDGVSIGNGCIIAAGAVVTKSFPANMVIGGVPAKQLKQRSNGILMDDMPN